jgi:tetratricopeptide (TPR) repeat protein
MEYYISILIFTFGIITWIPFFNTPYGQDQSGAAYLADQVLKKKITLFKDKVVYSIGHFLHIIALQYFFGKDNKYFNRFMCLWCSLSAYIVYWIVYDLFGLTAAIIAGISFTFYIVNPRIDGNFGPFENILALPLLSSILCILYASKTDNYVLFALSGMFFGYTILVKQTAVLYFPGFILMVIGKNISFASLLFFGGGLAFSNLIPLIYYWRKGAFWEYMACNWLMMIPSAINSRKYNKYYPRTLVKSEKKGKTKNQFIVKNSLSLTPMLFYAVITLFSLILNHNISFFHLGLFLCLSASIIMVFMRGTFFPHYWLYMVPWLVITASYNISTTISLMTANCNILSLSRITILFSLFIFVIYVDYKYFIPHKDPYGFIRKFHGDLMVETNYIGPKKIAKYINHITDPDDKILVCGHTPDILLYSDRSSFCPDICLEALDYIEIYSKSNPTLLGFLNSIYNFKIIKQKENIFKSGFPEIIVFSDGMGDIKDFEKLTNMCYSREETLGGYPLYRVDRELTGLMVSFENRKNKPIQETSEINSNKNGLSNILDPHDWNSALVISKQLLEKDPYEIEHLLTLGECLIGTGNYTLLFRFYNRLIESKMVSTTSRLELLAKLGEAYCHQDNFKEAEEIFRNILKLKPDNPPVLNNLGFVYSRQNNNKKASLCFQKALEIDPDNEDAKINLEQIKAIY